MIAKPMRLRVIVTAVSVVCPVLLALSGCGGGGLAAAPSNATFSISAARNIIDTNTTDQLSATLASGRPAAATWSIVTGENDLSIGQGSIDATGLYTPPQVLSKDSVKVQIKAMLQSNPATVATYLVTVTPGFVQSLVPENASVAAGGTLQLAAQIAEVSSGTVAWSLAATPAGGGSAGTAFGSLGQPNCQHSANAFTVCHVTYTAPAALPAAASFYLIATPNGNTSSTATAHVLFNSSGFSSSALQNQAAQTGAVAMGSSGGNDNDFDSTQNAGGGASISDCCGGTLGALVADQNSNQYILSNNHVLAESDQATAGDTIVQPGLVDLGCNPQAGRPVGSLRYFVPIGSSQTNVDAALAAVTPGAVDSSGAILQLGTAASGVLGSGAPAAGTGEALTASKLNQLQVVKSGRTTGLTCSTVNAVNLNVQVDYYYDCAETRPYYTKTLTNQIGMPGNSFTDSGDSGSLVLDAANAQPIGLFFAGGADSSNNGFSVASPIGDVLSELSQFGQSHGQLQFQVVGGAPHPISCLNYDQNTVTPAATGVVSPAALAAAKTAAESAAPEMVGYSNGILALDAGKSLDAPGEASVIVYVDQERHGVSVPQTIDGVRTLVIPTDDGSLAAGTAPRTLTPVSGIHLSAVVLRAAAAVQQQYAAQLMTDPAFFGVGVTQSYDNPAEAALLVLVDVKKTPKSMPATLGGLRVRYQSLNRLHVTRSKHASGPVPSSCALKSMLPADVEEPEFRLPASTPLAIP